MNESLITIENLEFFAHHGCYEAERMAGSRFLVNAELRYDATRAIEGDSVDEAIDYRLACRVIQREMEQPVNLLETLCSRILDALFATFPQLDHAKIKISKINPPIGLPLASASLTLQRSR